ncbi:hypothetical protein RRG08_002516 [Elysia crispata]|uniref:Endonuclease n=1 Tax=Elysia crispata TaxID=231223 RepID=A0AAE1A8C9_9GAST|nr:hypothetical protein RRG08_002516 [Elysia crispata]
MASSDMETSVAGEASVLRHTHLPLPRQFEGTSELWPRWRARFQRYRLCSGLSDKPNSGQVGTLLYTMGDVADDILAVIKLDETSCTFDEVMAALDGYFNSRKNTIFARAKFNRRVQQPGESVDAFIQDLHRLADECSYSTLKNELIRDRIVVGVRDDDLSKVLQAKQDLDLGEAIRLSRQAEARTESQNLLRPKVDLIQKSGGRRPQNQRPSQPRPQPPQTAVPGKKCGYCGRTPVHKKEACPARTATCHNCNKKGHYSSVCRSSKVREVQVQDEPFLGSVHHVGAVDTCWTAVIYVNGRPSTFKLDTGAAVSVVGESSAAGKELQPCDKVLKGPGDTPLHVLGLFHAQLQYKEREIQEPLYVIKGQQHSLLSGSACSRLGLVARLHSLTPGKADFKSEFPGLFKGLGRLKDSYAIKLRPDAQPVSIYTARKIAHPLMGKVKAEIDHMLADGVISPVEEPTDWCSGIVVVPKADNSSVRICVDLTALNKAVLREVHPLKSVDEDLARLAGSTIFTKLDARSGFWQMPLDPQSRLLTTFLTPFGRFCMNTLPFGISSAPEIFQRRMSEILHDIEGVICHMDDILVHAPTQTLHDVRVRAVLQRLQEAGLTLNEKCEFSRTSIRFLGHIIDDQGVHADPAKLEAVINFPAPANITELQRFLGMINQLAKFTPELATQTEPLRQLLKRDSLWSWGHQQEESFQKIKKNLTSTPILAHYCMGRSSIIAADASNAGLGAVLLQIQPDGSRRPVSYISRSLTPAEKNYAVIEKEALAATWASERFSEYILGCSYKIETDHKPLVPLLTTKELHKIPPRIQRFRLRLMRFNPEVVHVSGKQQVTADALSRAPIGEPSDADIALVDDAAVMAQNTVDFLPASPHKLQDIRAQQQADPELIEIFNFCQRGWPAFMPQNPLLQQYWVNQRHFTIVDEILLFDDRIVIPTNMRMEMLNKLHESHLGITKCRALAQTSVWWPNISAQIEDMVRKCTVCAKLRPTTKEPLLPSSFPEHPWSRVAMDLFDLHGKTYLLLVDYHSRWPEIRLLDHLTSAAIIVRLKSIFATHGIPEVVMSDNGPQFASAEFQKFTREFGFTHTTSSPRYPQANGEAERAVQTVKNLLRKATDPYVALLMYRATPLQNGLAPSELLMGRRLKTKLPFVQRAQPQKPDFPLLIQKEFRYRENQRQNYNLRHAVREAPELQHGDPVFVKDLRRPGSVIKKYHNPRSYIVHTEQGTIRRNRTHLVATPTPDQSPPVRSVPNAPDSSSALLCTTMMI